MATIVPTPPVYDLPLSLGGDLIADFRNRVPGSDPATYTDYPDGVSVVLEIDTAPDKTVATAVISTSHAAIWVESEVCDVIPKGVLWRCIYRIAGTPDTDIIVANGRTVRFDGR